MGNMPAIPGDDEYLSPLNMAVLGQRDTYTRQAGGDAQ
jgi:hypothetical protein